MTRYIYGLAAITILLLPTVVLGQGFLQNNRTSIQLSTQYPEYRLLSNTMSVSNACYMLQTIQASRLC